MKKTASTKKKWLEKHGTWVHFTPRDSMRRRRVEAGEPERPKARAPATGLPSTQLPVDCTDNGAVVCPMLGNDQYGDCGPVMCAHVDQIRAFGQGLPGFAPEAVDQTALVAQYEEVSGGDNGTSEDMLVGQGGIWTTGIAGDPSAVVVDHLDLDVTDAALAQYCIDQFYAVEMAWSVPDAFLSGFSSGSQWMSAATPDPENGHFSPLSDVDTSGNYRLFTWGAWCLVSPAFVASVDPECFVTFSALQFDVNGLDSHGRHVSDQAAAWVLIGGNASAVAQVVAKFPPKPSP